MASATSRTVPPNASAARSRTESAPQAARSRDPEFRSGTLSVAYENDVFAGNDNRYSSGLALGWVSTDIAELHRGNWLRRFGEAMDFLPAVGAAGRSSYVGLALTQEIYTPEGLQELEQQPGDHPYAGVLALDTEIYTKGERSLHAYSLRLGVVGPSAQAEDMQSIAHGFVQGVTPRGWEDQLEDEPLLNLDYAGYLRLARDVEGRRLGSDLTLHGGAGLGNYYIGADAGVTGRVGWGIADTYGLSGLVRGQHGLVGFRPERGWRSWLFLDLGGRVVGRFLPTDGNTWDDGPSGDRDSLFWNGTGGLVLAWERLRLTFSYEAVLASGGISDGHQRQNDFGTVQLSWSF